MNSSYKLLVSTICILVLGLAGLICGMLADHWFHIQLAGGAVTSNFGMLRMCVKKWSFNGHYETKCLQRSIQTFSDNTVWQLPIEGTGKGISLFLSFVFTKFSFFANRTISKKNIQKNIQGYFLRNFDRSLQEICEGLMKLFWDEKLQRSHYLIAVKFIEPKGILQNDSCPWDGSKQNLACQPSWHKTSKQRPSNVRNVHITLDER